MIGIFYLFMHSLSITFPFMIRNNPEISHFMVMANPNQFEIKKN